MNNHTFLGLSVNSPANTNPLTISFGSTPHAAALHACGVPEISWGVNLLGFAASVVLGTWMAAASAWGAQMDASGGGRLSKMEAVQMHSGSNPLVASLLLVAMPFAPFVASCSVRRDARSPVRSVLTPWGRIEPSEPHWLSAPQPPLRLLYSVDPGCRTILGAR